MSDKWTYNEKINQQQCYEIRLKGHLDDRWAEWFNGMAVTMEEDGDTLLTGMVIDQAALHGLIKKVRDSGLSLVSVSPVESDLVTYPPVRELPETDRAYQSDFSHQIVV